MYSSALSHRGLDHVLRNGLSGKILRHFHMTCPHVVKLYTRSFTSLKSFSHGMSCHFALRDFLRAI